MKCLYSVELAGYFRQLQKNPDPQLVRLLIGIQMNAQDHGMLADLMDASGNLKGLYHDAWLQESTPYRLNSAMARWDAEIALWHTTWTRVSELLRNRKPDEALPSIDAIRARN